LILILLGYLVLFFIVVWHGFLCCWGAFDLDLNYQGVCIYKH